MSWPIPELQIPDPPRSISWRTWGATLLMLLGAGAAAVVIFWPRGQTAHTVMFWVVAAGLPACLFAVVFGVRLDSWEQRRLEREEYIQESQRLKLLWHAWANRHVDVAAVTVFLGGIRDTDGWGQSDDMLPVNLGHSRALEWLCQVESEKRPGVLAALIFDRFSKHLKGLPSLRVVVLLDGTSYENSNLWEKAVQDALGSAHTRITVECLPACGALSLLSTWVDGDDMPATLVIAGQLCYGETSQPYSEDVAAILLHAGNHGKRQDEGQKYCRIPRPMVVLGNNGGIAADIQQMLDVQAGQVSIASVWLRMPESDVLSRLCQEVASAPATRKALVREVDGIVGTPGPASSWVALAMALEAGLRNGQSQLVAMHDDDTGQSVLCVALSQAVKGKSK